MIETVFLVIGLIVGVVVGWLIANTRKVAAEARLQEAQRQADEQKRLLDDAQQRLTDSFKALSSDALRDSNQAFLDLAKATFDAVVTDAKGDLGKRQEAIDGLIKPLREALQDYQAQAREMEKTRHQDHGAVVEQLKSVAAAEEQLQRETGNLVTALRRPEVRGRWGEITLRRVVELAGLSEHCDFDWQPSVTGEDGRLRPDATIKLPGERTVVVDAKAPLDAYLEAVEAADEQTRSEALERYAAHVRGHIRQLASKEYWAQFPSAADLVVLFLPGECFFSAALEKGRDLIEVGLRSRVLLASPSTLIALARSVALAWHEHRIVENARAIEDASRGLFDRVSKFAEHLRGIQDGLRRACNAYSDAVGSWQSRVVPQGRRVVELGGAGQGAKMSELEAVEVELRELPAASEDAKDA